jgi:hypothetical protein
MSIEARIVSDSLGKTEGTYIPTGSTIPVSIVGTIQAKDVYTFYAVPMLGSTKQDITIVLPVGGAVSGLYRFPRVGEKVLVSIETSGNFLLGYIPNESETQHSLLPFTADELPTSDAATKALAKKEADRTSSEKDAITGDLKAREKLVQNEKDKLLVERQGLILRYQQTGKKEDNVEVGEEYSEIGFYQQPTHWLAPVPDLAEGSESGGEDIESNTTDYNRIDERGSPKIDKIIIRSTGDIKSEAVNHNLIMGKRLEILADCPEIDYITNTDADGKLPLGDVKGDDSSLHAGDLHIRAGNRVVIKAGEEIRLQVGRSILTITDEGLNMITKKINSNWPNSFDTSLDLNPRSGISMFGQSVNISSAYSTQVGDSLGGSLSFSSGVASVSGREIKLGTQGKAEYAWLLVFAALEHAMNIGMVSAAKAGRDPAASSAIEVIQLAKSSVQELVEMIRSFSELYDKIKELGYKKKLKELEDELKKLDKTDQAEYDAAKKKLELEEDYKDALDWQEQKKFKDAKEDLDKRKDDDWTLTDASQAEVDAKAASLNEMVEKAQKKADDKQKDADTKQNDADAKQNDADTKQKDADAKQKIADDKKKAMDDEKDPVKKAALKQEWENAEAQAKTAKTGADTAKKDAVTAKTDADKANKEADTAKKEADKDKVGAAQTQADVAQKKADDAQAKADADPSDKALQEKAKAAKTDADKAKTDAAKAQEEVAKKNSEAADKAKTDADKAKKDADKAKTDADKAKTDADKAKKDADIKAEEAKKKAAEAKAKADADPSDKALQQQATDTQKQATEAQTKATDAQNDAQAKATEADKAKAKADAAQKKAETANKELSDANKKKEAVTKAKGNVDSATTANTTAQNELNTANKALRANPNDPAAKKAVKAATAKAEQAQKALNQATETLKDLKV